MSDMPFETCWALNKFWNNKFYYKVASCWLFLLSHTTMHGSMNTKSTGCTCYDAAAVQQATHFTPLFCDTKHSASDFLLLQIASQPVPTSTTVAIYTPTLQHTDQTHHHTGPSLKPRGLRPLAYWDCGFEYHRWYVCLLLSVLSCQVEVSATGWSFVQRSAADYHVSECDLET